MTAIAPPAFDPDELPSVRLRREVAAYRRRLRAASPVPALPEPAPEPRAALNPPITSVADTRPENRPPAATLLDPRPDLLDDHEPWRLVLFRALLADGHLTDGLYGLLHCLRCCGARLRDVVRPDGGAGWRLMPDPAYEGGAAAWARDTAPLLGRLPALAPLLAATHPDDRALYAHPLPRRRASPRPPTGVRAPLPSRPPVPTGPPPPREETQEMTA